jgi:thiamine-monophosphate kinase
MNYRSLRQAGELRLIELLKKRFPADRESVIIGIGDDAACLKPPDGNILITTDTMTEEIHFSMRYFTAYQVGYKLVVSNVSDIYAMDGEPLWAVVNITVPDSWGLERFEELLRGIHDASLKYGLSIVGGDLSSSTSKATFSMSIVGRAKGEVIRRNGARPGDRLFLTGPLGEASMGHELLKRIHRPVRIEASERVELRIEWDLIEPLLRRFLLPELVNPSDLSLKKNAMIDISDGLYIDLYRLCAESNVGARIYEDRLPVTEQMREVSEEFGIDLYRSVTSGGEDYHYLIATSETSEEGLYYIGDIVNEGLSIVRSNGNIEEITPEGYQHFVDS